MHEAADALRFRRLELGLSQRELARTAGVTARAIESLEGGGSLDAWPLGRIRRLLLALGLDLAWLDGISRRDSGRDRDEIRQLGAELARLGRIHPDQLFGLEADVIESLRSRLYRAGIGLRDADGLLALCPAAGVEPLPRLICTEEEGRLALKGLSDAESSVMGRIVMGSFDAQRIDAAERRALAVLVRVGLVVREEEHYSSSDALASVLTASGETDPASE